MGTVIKIVLATESLDAPEVKDFLSASPDAKVDHLDDGTSTVEAKQTPSNLNAVNAIRKASEALKAVQISTEVRSGDIGLN